MFVVSQEPETIGHIATYNGILRSDVDGTFSTFLLITGKQKSKFSEGIRVIR
jgi:hypothetical protein